MRKVYRFVRARPWLIVLLVLADWLVAAAIVYGTYRLLVVPVLEEVAKW